MSDSDNRNLIQRAGDWINGAFDTARGAGEDIWETISGLPTSIGDLVSSIFTQAIAIAGVVWDVFTERISDIVEGFFKGIGNLLTKDIPNLSLLWVDRGVERGHINVDDGEQLKETIRSYGLLSPIVSVFFMGWTGLQFFKLTLTATTGDLRKNRWSEYTPESLTPETLAVLFHRFPDRIGEIVEKLSENGLNESDRGLLFRAAERVSDIDEIRILQWRGLISADNALKDIMRLGFPRDRAEIIQKAFEFIPGPQDLFTLVSKEAFEDELARSKGLDSEFPTDQQEFLTKQGISLEWQQRYWRAHWSAPSIQQGYEMLWRNKIEPTDLDDLFKILEMPDFWRKALTEISFRPYTRVDLRRLRAAGLIETKDVMRNYLDQGYDEEKAGKLTEFAELQAVEGEKNLTRAQILRGYRDGDLIENEAIELLRRLRYSDATIAFMLRTSDSEEARDLRDDEIDHIGQQYRKNLITEDQARTSLGALQVPTRQRDKLIVKWTPKRSVDQFGLSKRDYDNLFQRKLIDEPNYRFALRQLGYVEQATRLHQALTDRLLDKGTIMSLFAEKIIKGGEFREEMGKLGYSEINVERLLDLAKKA